MIADFIRTCVYCQINKPNNRPNKAPVKTFPTPEGPFQEFGFDLIGPLEDCDSGNTYVLTEIDFFSRKGYCEREGNSRRFCSEIQFFRKVCFLTMVANLWRFENIAQKM
jgi:hypothetical protein